MTIIDKIIAVKPQDEKIHPIWFLLVVLIVVAIIGIINLSIDDLAKPDYTAASYGDSNDKN